MFPDKNLQFYCARWTPSRIRSIWAPTSHTLGEIAKKCQKVPKKKCYQTKISIYILYMKIDRFSMGDRNLGSESRFGQNENFENFKTALIWTPRVELSSYYENMVLCYKSLFLRRFLELRLSVFFRKKKWNFQNVKEKFWKRSGSSTRASSERRGTQKKKSLKNCSFSFFLLLNERSA